MDFPRGSPALSCAIMGSPVDTIWILQVISICVLVDGWPPEQRTQGSPRRKRETERQRDRRKMDQRRFYIYFI